MKPIRVLIVDDHRMFVQGIQTLLEQEQDLVVAGTCTNGAEALDAIDRLQPDVVLLDLNMPGMDGMAATRAIRDRWPEMGVIILSMYRDDAYVFSALKQGAKGYVLKDAETAEVVRAIRAVAQGESFLDPALTTRVLSEFQRVWENPRTLPGGLNEREVAILRLIAQGKSNREIGADLNFSEKTIKNYITVIFQKLNLSDRTQAAVYALQNNLVDQSTLTPPER